MKRMLSLLLTLILAFGSVSTVLAEENVDTQIMSIKKNEEICDYANNVYLKHLHTLIETGELKESIETYSLGQPFTVFNVKEKNSITCFPVLSKKSIVAILEVVKIEDEYTSMLSVAFSKELKESFRKVKGNQFVLLTDGVRLQIFDGKVHEEIFRLYDDGKEDIDLTTEFDLKISELSRGLTYDDLIQSSTSYSVSTRGVIKPSSYKTLNVKGISQGNHPWCWAATCAALINYYKGTTLSASSVAKYVFPSNPEQGGSWNDIKKAYNHWKLYPTQTGIISFKSIKSLINSNSLC